MREEMKIRRRTALKLLSGGALGLAGLGFGPRSASAQEVEEIAITDELVEAAKQEGEMYYRYSAQTPTTEAIVNEFTKKYGINVTLERRVAAEGTNTFLAEERAGQHIVDVHVNTDRKGMIMLTEGGYYQPYRVENDDDYDQSVKLGDYGYSVYMNTSTLPFNTERISVEEAVPLFDGTWEGLLDPRLKDGRIGIVTPFVTIATSGWFWGLSESPKYGDDFLRKVAEQNPIIYSDQAIGGEGLYAGEVDVLIGVPIEEIWKALAAGAPLAWTYPDILPAIPTVFHYISTNAPHPNAARLFCAWILSREGARVVQVNGGRTSTINLDLPMAPAIQEIFESKDWWEPMPAESRFSPSVQRIIDDEDGYRQKMVEMFNISRRG